jgi:DNA-binding NarL/FixJ family response regulator
MLVLLLQGLTNRDIAAALAISVRTVGRHVENIYNKTGRGSRLQLHRLFG